MWIESVFKASFSCFVLQGVECEIFMKPSTNVVLKHYPMANKVHNAFYALKSRK